MEGADDMSADLTPSMEAALREVIRRPGQFAQSYPGGRKSVRALLRRDLVRVNDSEVVHPTYYGFRVGHDLWRVAS